MVMAVAILGLLAITMAAVMTVAAGDFSRNRLLQQQLQDKQFEQAIIILAHSQLRDQRQVDGVLPMPAEAGTATIRWENESDATKTANIKRNDRDLQVRFVRKGTDWSLAPVSK
jgi:hypothetical protein